MQITKAQHESAFVRLADALKKRPLKNENGSTRIAEAEEFMLMQIQRNGIVHFKHGDSRNYVFLLLDGSLHVPETAEPFQRGTFDQF